MNRKFAFGLGTFAALNAADVAVSAIAFRLGGAEGNPATQALLNCGFAAALTVKALIVLGIVAAITWCYRQEPKTSAYVLAGLNIYYTLIVAWNLYQVFNIPPFP